MMEIMTDLEIQKKFDKCIKFIKAYAMLNSPFFGSIIYASRYHLLSDDEWIKRFGSETMTACTDGVGIFFCHKMVDEHKINELAGVIIHEALHVGFLHIPRAIAGNKNALVYNHAADFVINLMIKDAFRGKKDKVSLPEKALLDERYREMSTEQVYEILLKEYEKNSKQYYVDFGKDGDLKIKDKDGNPVKVSDKEKKKIKKQLQKAVQTAKQTAGDIPGGLQTEIDQILKPKVDWRSQLKDFIQSFPADFDFMSRDRRFMQTPFIIPSLTGEKVKIGVAIDTSGSISDKELAIFLSEIYAIIATYNNVELLLMSIDTEINVVKTIYNKDDLNKFKMVGRGGTRFIPAFEYINEIGGYHGLLYLTDGFAEFPENKYNFKTIWLITNETVKPPFGRVIRYQLNNQEI